MTICLWLQNGTRVCFLLLAALPEECERLEIVKQRQFALIMQARVEDMHQIIITTLSSPQPGELVPTSMLRCKLPDVGISNLLGHFRSWFPWDTGSAQPFCVATNELLTDIQWQRCPSSLPTSSARSAEGTNIAPMHQFILFCMRSEGCWITSQNVGQYHCYSSHISLMSVSYVLVSDRSVELLSTSILV